MFDSFLRAFSHPLVISLLPSVFAGAITMIVVHTYRVDRRMRKKGALYPLEILGALCVVGMPLGAFFQWGTKGLVSALTELPQWGGTAYLIAAISAPFWAWAIHRVILWKNRNDPVQLAEWKVKYFEGRDNMDMNGNGIPNDQRSARTMMDMVDASGKKIVDFNPTGK